MFLLFRDDVGEMIQEEKNQAFYSGFYTFESAGKIMIRKKKNTADIPSEAEEKLKEQTQELCTNIDNSIGWINVPENENKLPCDVLRRQ